MSVSKTFILIVGPNTDAVSKGACFNCSFYNRPLFSPPYCSHGLWFLNDRLHLNVNNAISAKYRKNEASKGYIKNKKEYMKMLKKCRWGGVNIIVEDICADSQTGDLIFSNLLFHPAMLLIVLFRQCSYFRTHKKNPVNLLLLVVEYPLYKTLSMLLGIEIPLGCKIGKGFHISHNHAVAINKDAIIGDNFHIYQCCTIGENKGFSPVIGNNVTVFANSVVVGGVKIGNYSIVGACSIVTKDIPDKVIVAGNPAKIIKKLN